MTFRSSVPRTALAIALAVGGAALSSALPPRSGVLPPAVVKDSAPASRLDTRTISPQINDKFVYHPEHPENPMEFPELPGIKNNLVAGAVHNAQRIAAGALWPAIDATGWTPPDPDLAVGPGHVVAVVNSSLAFFDKSGNKQFQQDSETFFSGLGATSFQFDPKCFYDRAHSRFVILYLEQADSPATSKLLLAVSDDNDPNGTWYRYRLEALLDVSGSQYWLDYPGFGYNKDAYVVTGNMFGFAGGFAGVQFLVVPSAPILTGGSATVYSLRDGSAASAQVGETINPLGNYVYAACRSGTSALRVYAVSNAGTSPSVSFDSVAVPSFSTPQGGAPSTNGQTLDSLDGRLMNVTVRNGHLVTAHTIQEDTMLNARWYDVALNGFPSGTPDLSQSGNIGSSTVHYFMPAVSMNAAGDMSVIFSGSSSSVTADIMVAGRMSTDPIGGMGTPFQLEASAGASYGQYRWGDYFGCDVDPVDDKTFWGISMGVAGDNNWRTAIFTWVITSTFPDVQSVAVAPTTVVGGTNAIGTVTLDDVAPPGGMRVSLRSSDIRAATVPANVLVPNGQTSANFTVKTLGVTQPAVATITATSGTSSATADVTVTPPGIADFWLSPTTVAGGTNSTGTVVLAAPAPPGGALVRIALDNPSAAAVDWPLIIPEGQTTGTFPVRTFAVSETTPVLVWAAYPGPTKYATLTVTPAVGVKSLTLTPASVKGGKSSKGTVTLTMNAPTSMTITLGSSDPATATTPATVTIAAGSKTATFTITTKKVLVTKKVTISAQVGSVGKTATLSVTK